ncbi:hypothetical protein H6G93_16160 [Nostoc sp. FACHB-973]|nr:calcium-binding protein [Desmonostoc muscorum]MBD2516522.1 hypothetical protein [Nostoc sp. FACHB-973]MCF2150499.1 hypothetical protein [Desmonostoc muscorum LEGE 12446]
MSYVDFYGTTGNDVMFLVPDEVGKIQRYYGQEGDDTFYATTGHGGDTVNGGDGIDTLIVDYSANNYQGVYESGIKMYDYGSQFQIHAWRTPDPSGAYADSVHFTNIEKLQITGTFANDFLFGLNYDDKIYGNAGNDTIDGRSGNNFLDGGNGNDTITAGNNYGNGNDTIYGGDGDDLIKADWLGVTGAGNDQVYAGSGNDTIIAGGGIDVIDGGSGIDVVKGIDLSAATTGLVFNDLGVTQTEVSLSNGAKLVDVEYVDELIIGSGDDTITYTSSRNQIIKTGAGNDTVTAGIGYDVVDGGTGIDVLKVDYSANTYTGSNAGLFLDVNTATYSGSLYARNSSSTSDQVVYSNIERFDIKGTNAADLIRTGNFNDQIAGNSGNDSINSYGGDDLLDGGEGNDTILGGVGKDSITGSSGNDLLVGQDGNDLLIGGTGADRFGFGFNAAFNTQWLGVDTIEDFESGTDKIALNPMTFGLASGPLSEQMFATVVNDGDAAKSSALIVYNSITGGLFYNQNGATDGLGTGAQFANLNNLSTLTAADFVVQYF